MLDTKLIGKRSGLLILGAAVTLIAACGHDDHNGNTSATTPPPSVQSVDFESYAKTTFMNEPNSTPVDPSATVFTFDVNSDPTAFDGLLM